MPSQVKDFLDIIKDIRGTNFDDTGLPTEGFWYEVKVNKDIVAADKAIVAADKAIVAADKALIAVDRAAVTASNAATVVTITDLNAATEAAVDADRVAIGADKVSVDAALDAVNAQVIVANGYVTLASDSSVSAAASAATATTKAAEATTARNYAYDWATAPEDDGVNDGINPAGFSAFHWSQKAAAVVGGVTGFTDLTDAPATYVGQATKFVRVNAGANAVEFYALGKSDVGLSNVDNTTDMNKPINTATIAALAGKMASTSTVAVQINTAASKSVPVDTDELGLTDSVAAFVLKKFTWANLKTVLSDLFITKDSATGAALLPTGTTAQRPTGTVGQIRYNSTITGYEGFKSGNWLPLGGGATGGGTDDVFYVNGQTVNEDFEIILGKNAHSIGPITVVSGKVVTIAAGSRWVVS